jgi:hypothetical protein
LHAVLPAPVAQKGQNIELGFKVDDLLIPQAMRGFLASVVSKVRTSLLPPSPARDLLESRLRISVENLLLPNSFENQSTIDRPGNKFSAAFDLWGKQSSFTNCDEGRFFRTLRDER